MRWLKRTQSTTADLWPTPEYDPAEQPHFLFILTPPNSGSTALSELINTCHGTMILQSRGEAQWLVPGLCDETRWNPDKPVDYESVKAVWLAKYQETQRLVGNITHVIEKSPPNMMRAERLASCFTNYSFLANNRDPYANCASLLHRKYDAKDATPELRAKYLEILANDWLVRSKTVHDLIERLSIPLVTYEQFCEQPASLKAVLDLPQAMLDAIDPDAKVQVKDYAPQAITNQNERQISRLSDAEIALVSSVLAPHETLLQFYDYAVR